MWHQVWGQLKEWTEVTEIDRRDVAPGFWDNEWDQTGTGTRFWDNSRTGPR